MFLIPEVRRQRQVNLCEENINITSLVSYSSILCKLNVTHNDKLELCIWLLFLKVKIYCYIYLFTYFMCVCSHHYTQIEVRWQTVNWFSVCCVSSRNPAQVARCSSKCLHWLKPCVASFNWRRELKHSLVAEQCLPHVALASLPLQREVTHH